jgi:hypothetical protein
MSAGASLLMSASSKEEGAALAARPQVREE